MAIHAKGAAAVARRAVASTKHRERSTVRRGSPRSAASNLRLSGAGNPREGGFVERNFSTQTRRSI